MHPIIPYFEPIKFVIPIPGTDGVPIHGFGILVATGFLAGSWLAQRKARRDGFDPEVINRLLGWLVVGVFVGGHLGHALLYDPKEYFEHPLEFLKVWEGLSSFGGFVACAIIVWAFLKRNRLPFWPYADSIAYGLTLGWALGRCGCTVAKDHPGTITQFWLGFPGMCPGGDPLVACHNLGFYEALFAFGLLGLFLWLNRKPRFPGFYVGWLCTLYAPARFGMDFLRHPDIDNRYAGLTPAQWGCLVMLPLGLWFLFSRSALAPLRGEPEAPPAPESSG